MGRSSSTNLKLPADVTPLPDGWRYEPLGALVDANRGISYGVVQPGTQNPLGIPIIRVNNIRHGRILTEDLRRVDLAIESQYERTRLRGGEVLLSLVGTLGETAIVPDELAGWNVARAVAVIPVLSDVGGRWINLCLRSPQIQHYIRTWATTTVQATFNLRDATKLPIPMPPEEEREAIAHILGTLDDKIELNQQMNQTLEAIARALFKSWFIDFDPVRAKMDGRQPAGIDAETAALFPAEFEDRGAIGQIPKGWKVGVIDDLINILSGGTPKTSVPEYWEGNIPWFSVKDAPTDNNVYVLETEKYITEAGVNNSSTQILSEGTTIVSARGTVGRLALVGVPMTMNQSCYGIQGKEGYTDLFTYYFLRSAITSLQQQTHGTVFETITRQTFTTVKSINPPAAITQAFDEEVQPLLHRIRSSLIEIRSLASIRDALLPKLLSGEIRVKDAEEVVAEVA